MAVSDAAMLAPEEIFVGKGNIKDESELTQEDRKRRRAKKKRKFKGKEVKNLTAFSSFPSFLTPLLFTCETAESANQPIKKARDVTSENPKTGIFFILKHDIRSFKISKSIRC